MNKSEIIIKEMSQITIDEKMLKQIDMHGLLKKFKQNHAKLDDFKKTRDEYENRGLLKKGWDLITGDDTMNNAQLDATELQAEFSKTLGQLMVISIAQSQHLQQQQEQLTSQQNIIKNQTEKIEFQTHELDQQQERLAKQNTNLEKLVNDYFELRGLTQDGAKKLISIASDIQHTKDDLLQSMEQTRTWVTEQQDKIHTEVSSKILMLEEYTQKNVNDIIERYEIIASESDKVKNELQSFDDKFTQSYEELSEIIAEDKIKFLEHINTTDKKFIASENNINTLQNNFVLTQDQQKQKMKYLWISVGINTSILLGLMVYIFIK